MNKIVLGTVQFGVNYGINNTSGQVSLEEVCKILRIAEEKGIKTLDTSSGYGASEIVLGKAIKETNTSLFNNEIYKSLLKSNHHKGKLILLDEKQPLDENESYQKILELFLEENDPIPSLRKEGDANFYNKYLLLLLP